MAISAGAVILIPCEGQWAKARRFALRPFLAVLVILVLSNFAIASNDEWEDKYWDKQIDAYCQEVSEFLDTADEVILYQLSDCYYSPYFSNKRIRCACGAFHNVIMIDYDTMRIAFLQHDWITDFHIYELKPGALTEENQLEQLNALLPQSQTRLITYYPDADSNHRTCALELVLADGTVFSTTDTPDQHWDSAYLDLSVNSSDYMFPVGQPHPKPQKDAE